MSTLSGPLPSIRRILHPTDFSEHSNRAFLYANSLAESTGAEIVLLYVDEPVDMRELDDGGDATEELLDPLERLADREATPVDRQVIRKLNAFRPIAPGIRLSRVVRPGPPGEVICWFAQQHQCDLIVMGTEGRSGLAHLLFGSVAEWVLRNARCPVLTVRQRQDGDPPLPEPQVKAFPRVM